MPPIEILPLWELLLGVAVLLGGLGVLGLASSLLVRKRTPHRRPVPVLLASVLLMVAGAVSGTFAVSKYFEAQTWTFTYYVGIEPNGTAPEAIIVPIPRNESLLSNLQVSSGIANWSLVDTAHGRGLYVAVTGRASVESSVPRLPRGFPQDEYSPSMAMNATLHSAETWTFYSGTSGVHIRLYIQWWLLDGVLAQGWTVHEVQVAPPP